MYDFIFKRFVKDHKNHKDPSVRRAYGSVVAVIGIIANIFLAAFKFLAGIMSGALSITADGMNNLSDAGSQVVSLISFKISGKPADRDHPFGHARIEYVASMIVSFIVLLVGAELLGESVDKIFHPESATYGNLVLIILAVSIVVKLWLAIFGKSVAKKIRSEVIRASSADSLSDAIATTAVLASALISRFTSFETDAYMGVVVAFIIIIAGIKLLNDTKNSILGSPPDPEVVEGIIGITEDFPEILGIHDMVVHNYGPGNTIASFHAEVDGEENVFVTHDVIDTVEKRLYAELGVRATVHMDPIVTNDESVNELRAFTEKTVKEVDERFGIHDFRFVRGITHSNLIFDVTVPFEVKDSNDDIKRKISSQISLTHPDFFAVITVDRE